MSGNPHVAAVGRRAAIGLAAAGLAALLAVLGPSVLDGSASAEQTRLDQTAVANQNEARAAYAKLPLSFVPNAGQLDRRVRYSAQAGGASFYFTKRAAVFSFTKKHKGVALRLGFIDANPRARISGRRLGKGRVNYLLGDDPSRWRRNLPAYGEVFYRDLWPGIDAAFRGKRGTLKYEFHLAPGARASDIRLGYRGAAGLTLAKTGNLLIRTPLGPLVDSRPLAYQEIEGRRIPVKSRYTVRGLSYGLALGAYDRGRPLVIDPGLVYSTYLGGSSEDQGLGIAVDTLGSAYVTGFTFSNPFPTTPGAFDTSHGGSADAFVTKLDPSGSALVYSTYLGESGDDRGLAVAVDGAGNAYVTGGTTSALFPTTPLAFDTTHAGALAGDAFVTKLNTTGSALLYSTFLGGTLGDRGDGIAVDAIGNAYVTGLTFSDGPPSTAFPTTPGAFATTHNGGNTDAFVTKLNAAGSAPLLYSTYLGGSANEEGFFIAVDGLGNAHVTGTTSSTNFPTTPAAFDTSYNGGVGDAFVTKLNTTGSAPVYSTYLGGSANDQGHGVTTDATGDAYVTGLTSSSLFPTTPGAFDMTHNGSDDVFVTKLDALGSAPLLYSTFLGGSGPDQGYGVALDAVGNAYVTGSTVAVPPNPFPTTPGAFDTSHNGSGDAFVTKLNAAGSAPLLYSTFLGGSAFDQGFGVAVDTAANAYVTGLTSSGPPNPFPTTPLAFDTDYSGNIDAFVTKLDMIGAPQTLVLDPPTATNPVGTTHTVTATVTDANGQPVQGVVVHFTVTGAHMVSGSCPTNGNGQCAFGYLGVNVGGDTISAYADTDDDGIQDPDEPTGAATKVWTAPTGGCPPNGGDDDGDDDGLEDRDERLFGTLLGKLDSDGDGLRDGNDDSDNDGEDDEDEDDGTDDECPNDSDGDGEDDEDEDDDDEDDD